MKMNNSLIGVVGYPLKQSLSKQIHEENIRKQGLSWEFKALEWELKDFEKNIQELKQDQRCLGFSVTMPYKEKIMSHLDECEEFAQRVSSVNCVKNKNGKWVGSNTDAPGFLAHLTQWNPVPPKTVKIIVVGTGATGRTLSFALAEAGYKNFVLINRTFEKAQEWGGELRRYFTDIKVEILEWGDPSAFGLGMTDIFILNTTPLGMPLGMKGEVLEWVDVSNLQNPVWLFDVTYNPPETLLIRKCKSRCFYTMNGWPMFQEQACLAFQIWAS